MGTSGLLAPLHDRAIHEIDFGLALGENILQHAGAVFAGSVGAFLHQLAGIAMQFDPKSLGDGFAFGDQIVEKLAGRSEARGGPMMQQRQRANRIGGGVKDELGPLRSTSVLSATVFIPERVIRPASSSTRVMGVLVGSKGPIQCRP